MMPTTPQPPPVPRRLARLPASRPARGLVVHEAVSRRARARGLAGLDDLPPGHGLHLRPCRSVHTLGMRFALDLLWLDAAGVIVRIDEDVAPGRVRTCLRARSVVEVRAGERQRFLGVFRA
jgi:uncharacterized membrane protein (UPF0127 family)